MIIQKVIEMIIKYAYIKSTMSKWPPENKEEDLKEFIKKTSEGRLQEFDVDEILEEINERRYEEVVGRSQSKRIAGEAKHRREVIAESKQFETILESSPIEALIFSAVTDYSRTRKLVDFINSIDSFSEFDQSLEAIDNADKETSYQAIRAYMVLNPDKFDLAVRQHANYLLDSMQNKPELLIIQYSEDIQTALDLYLRCCFVCDMSFPSILRVKRCLEGGNYVNKDLHSMPHKNVRDELKRGKLGSRFGKIVHKFDTRLRNGIAHGDVVINPYENKLTIPSENLDYNLSNIERSLRQGVALALFLAEYGAYVNARAVANIFDISYDKLSNSHDPDDVQEYLNRKIKENVPDLM